MRGEGHQRENVPRQPSHRTEGFAAVAKWTAMDPDNETLIYRKFDELAARNLLYLQSELLFLEQKLYDMDKKDASSDDMDLKDAARTWETLMRQIKSDDQKAKDRMALIRDLRAKMREYRM
jgi:hypothetical protein